MRLLFAYTCLLLFVLFSSALLAQTEAPSLKVLIEKAIQKDYGLQNQQLEIKASGIDQKQLQEEYLPRVALGGKYAFLLSSFHLKTENFRIPQLNIEVAEGNNRFTSTNNLLSGQLEAKALLYSGGKIPWLKKALQEKIKAQTFLLETDRQEMIGEVAAAYDQLALLKQIRLVLDESEKRLAENKKTADKAFSYGLITRYEQQKVEVAQAQLASKIAEYEGKRSLVLEQLQLLTDIEEGSLALINDTLRVFTPAFTRMNIDSRSELQAFDAAINAGKYNVRAAQTWLLPKVQAASSLGYLGLLGGHLSSSEPVLLGGSKLSAASPHINTLPVFSAGIGFTWELFDGKAARRATQKAEIAVSKTENEKKELLEKLELNLVKCPTDLRISQSQVMVTGRQQQTASNALTQATKEYRSGLIKSAQLIDAEEDYQQAALGYIQAVYGQRR